MLDVDVRPKLNTVICIPEAATKPLIKHQNTPDHISILPEVLGLRHETIRLIETFHIDLFHKHDNIVSYCKRLHLQVDGFIEEKGVVTTLHGPVKSGSYVGLTSVINTHVSNEKKSEFELLKTNCNVAILLTIISVLCINKYYKKLKGSVKFIFDPVFKSEKTISTDVFAGLDQIYGFALRQDYPFGTLIVTVDDSNKNYQKFIHNAFTCTFGENDDTKYILNTKKDLRNVNNSIFSLHDKYGCFIEIGCGNEINSNCLMSSVQILMDLIMESLMR